MTASPLRLLVIGLPLIAALPAHAMPTGGVCLEGNCDDGIGVFRDNTTGLTYRGPFSDGRFAPNASYEVTDPTHPGTVYPFTTDASRDWNYVELWRTDTQFFAGTGRKFQNPFTHYTFWAYSKGQLLDGPDVTYDGDFEYVSLPPTDGLRAQTDPNGIGLQSGIFMFSGTRTTKSTGQQEYGIFASEPVKPKTRIILSPADPVRIAQIRQNYLAATAAQSQQEARQQAAANDGPDLLGTLFQAAAGGLLASSMGQMAGALGGGGPGGVNALNLSQVVGVMTGATSPDQAMAAMTQQYMAQGLGAAVGATSPQDFAALAAGLSSGGTVASTHGAVTAATLAQARALMPPTGTTAAPPPAAGSGSRVPALEMMTLPCTNENGSFTGQSKVPKAAADCRAEVIAHRKVQCRADWMTDPSYAAMKACFQKKGIADLSQWR
ncbi:hypothetical protein [Novispirillum itersonii]|uniref:Uncharacterized protein n=1 Tax=Novispirillum itersonii TaxID=189 RepID=A0A7W9ZEY4_NOVIT|nr:hypothetical protein [Novispirillum itersonii]MBB6208779.1 hypothetical protein [Novispirillum itersonii]